ncbi:MAG TPA: hypothetical protein VLH79_11995 [Chthonomonadales bacterium]|nr:hypothetical protein [Chthonomonadales bacterium]
MNGMPDGGGKLAPATASVLGAIVSAHLSSGVSPGPGVVTAAACVRYLCGSSTPEESSAVRRAMLADGECRRDVRAALLRLDALRAMPWADAMRASLDEGWAGQVSAAWLELCADNAIQIARARTRWSGEAWGRLRDLALSGAADAALAWEAFRCFAAASLATLPAAAHALTRGPAPSASGPLGVPLGGMPQCCDVESATAAIGSTGALTVRVRLRPREGMVLPPSARVSLQGPADAWPLAEPAITNGALDATVEGFGEATGLPEGPVPAGLVVVELGGQAAPAVLRVALPDGRGSTELPIAGPPRVESGTVQMRVDIGESLLAMHRGARLVLRLAGAHGGQTLAAWPLRTLRVGWNSLIAPAPQLGPDSAAALIAEIVEETSK